MKNIKLFPTLGLLLVAPGLHAACTAASIAGKWAYTYNGFAQ
jgi:hypothetical protein